MEKFSIGFRKDPEAIGFKIETKGGFFGGSSHVLVLGKEVNLDNWETRKKLAELIKNKTGKDIDWRGREGERIFEELEEAIRLAEKYNKTTINLSLRSEGLPESGSRADDDEEERKAA